MSQSTKDFFEEHRQVLESRIKLRGEYIPRHVEIRLDPLFELHSTHICLERAQRGGSFKPTKPYEMKPQNECIFCKEGGLYEKTPDERRFHNATEPAPGYELISFPNLFPFADPHIVTVISDNVNSLDLLNLQKGDIIRYLESGYDLAREFSNIEGVTGMFDFINWGPEAGASLDHPHAQRGGLVDMMRTVSDREIAACEATKRETREDRFEKYIGMMKRLKDNPESLYCFENDSVVVFAPFAPRFSDQVDIVFKPEVNNILDIRPREREDVADAMIKVLHSLGSLDKLPENRKRRKVTDLNVALHQARFGDKRDYYRVHWHITPRMSKMGSLEALYSTYVVDVLPETTAENIRTLIATLK